MNENVEETESKKKIRTEQTSKSGLPIFQMNEMPPSSGSVTSADI
jgi:hypothetical protein